MAEKPAPKTGAANFVDSMLQSAQQNTQPTPQNRFGDVKPEDIESIMANIKKGKLR